MTASPSFLSPVSVAHFMAEHWGRKVLHVRRAEPDHFAGLLSLAELDRIVTSIRIPASNFNLARGDDPLPFASYCVGNDFVDKRRALALHQQGATIILRALEQWSPGLNRLRVEAETLFGCESQINVYLTPPAEKSTPPHWDTHDLMVLQIAGSKRWRLFRGERTKPLSDERFRVGADYVSPDREEIVLNAGDTLYLPRGVIHEPVSESYSVHVSLGLNAYRGYDLAAAALRLLARREGSGLRELLSGEGLAADSIDGLSDAGLLEAAGRELQQRFEAERAVDLEGRLLEIQHGATLDPQTCYSWRPGLKIALQPAGQQLRVGVNDEQISVPAHLGEAVRCALAAESFSPSSLPASAPLEDRLAMCVALWEISALRMTVPPGSRRGNGLATA
jgi:ribosomal protein L16 Arg81 hydroxylase